jgi:predicted nucleic acid-binding protein
MNGKFFLDTNIFVYSFDAGSPKKAARAADLIRRAIETKAGMVSYQVVEEFFNLALRRFAQPMSGGEAEQYLATTFRPLLAVHSSHDLFGHALQLNSRHKLAWYDSLIVASAIQGRCSILYSEDLQHERRFGDLRIENPFS